MYYSIGGGVILDDEEIIGIFDLDITSQSIRTRDFLKKAEINKEVINASEDIPKSYVVTAGKNTTANASVSGETSSTMPSGMVPLPRNGKVKNKVYLSQMNTATLIKRSENFGKEFN